MKIDHNGDGDGATHLYAIKTIAMSAFCVSVLSFLFFLLVGHAVSVRTVDVQHFLFASIILLLWRAKANEWYGEKRERKKNRVNRITIERERTMSKSKCKNKYVVIVSRTHLYVKSTTIPYKWSTSRAYAQTHTHTFMQRERVVVMYAQLCTHTYKAPTLEHNQILQTLNTQLSVLVLSWYTP